MYLRMEVMILGCHLLDLPQQSLLLQTATVNCKQNPHREAPRYLFLLVIQNLLNMYVPICMPLNDNSMICLLVLALRIKACCIVLLVRVRFPTL